MAKLIIMSGLPASGKSTKATELVAQGNTVRINRDLLREMLHCGKDWNGKDEGITKDASRCLAKLFLEKNKRVIIDDCNINQGTIESWKQLTKETNANYEILELKTPINECIKRDKHRKKSVGNTVILNMAIENDIIKAINDFPGYYVDKYGNVFSFKNKEKIDLNKVPLILKGGLCSNKHYLSVNLANNKKCKKKMIHSLIAETFLKKENESFAVCHNDGNSLNNELTNLRWDSYSANNLDRYKHGTDDMGVHNSRSIMKEEEIIEIKKLLRNPELTQEQIAKKFNVNRIFIAKIKNCHRYANVGFEKIAIFDIDGSLAEIEHRRHFVSDGKKNWNDFFKNMIYDTPRQDIVDILLEYYKTHEIVIVSGRPENYKKQTVNWL